MNEETRNEPVARIRDDVDALHTWAESLNKDVLDIDDATFEETAAYLEKLRQALTLIRDSEHALEKWISQIFRDQRWREPHTVSGVGEVEVRRGQKRKRWDHPGLAKAVLEALITSRGGEAPTPWDVRDVFMSAAGIGYWKVGELKRLGIDVSDYCEEEPGLPRVEIRS